MGTAVPQTFQDQPQIVSGTAQQHIHAVAFSALEMVAAQPAVMFQMTNDRLNRLATLQTFSDAGANPALLSRDVYRTVGLIMTTVTAVHKHLLDGLSAESANLVQGRLQRVTVIRIARQSHPADHEVAAVGHRNAHLDPELVALMRLALTDALHLRCMQTVQLVGTGFFLDQQPSGHGQLLGKNLLQPLIRGDPAFNVAHHPSQVGVQLTDLSAHPPHLSRMGITVDSIKAPRTQARIALTQTDTVIVAQ